MKRSLLVLLSVGALALIPAVALSADGPYLGVNARLVFPTDSDLSDQTGGTETVEFDTGFGVGAALGYKMGAFRFEGELSYAVSDHKTLKDPAIPIGLELGGDTSVTSFLLNGYYDFKTGAIVTPYLTAGIGLSQVSVDASLLGLQFLDDDDTVFAYQLGIGAGFELSPKLTLDLGYRYFATSDPEFTDSFGDKFEAEYSSHNIMAGLRYSF